MTYLTPEAAVTLRQEIPLNDLKDGSGCPERLKDVPRTTKAIYADDIQIGDLTIYDVPGRPFCYLKQLNVDYRYINMGFRRRAIHQLIRSLKKSTRVRELVVTISPRCANLICFYEGMGFFNSGELVDGEYVFKLAL